MVDIVEIQDWLNLRKGYKMLETKSVDQILSVLRKFRSRYARGEPVTKAYQGAVEAVRKDYDVAYQTIGDLCRRRLELRTINDFYELLEKWVTGNAQPLIGVLLEHTGTENHHKIADHFKQNKHGSDVRKASPICGRGETFTLRLAADAAKKLKILSIESPSSSEWLSEVVAEVVEQHYENWLKEEFKGKEIV